MKGMRVARIVASVVALMIAGAAPEGAAPQSRAAETSRQGPTPDEVTQVRAALAEYRKAWTTEFDAETRAIAVRYGAPTPDDLDRMFRDWLAGGIALMPELPAGVTGKLADAFKMMPNKTPIDPAVKPGMELPDFAKGAEPEALQSLETAKADLNETRDKHAETASCSPEALSAKQALQTKLDAYRKALSDMEAARADVERESGAGAAVESATKWAALNSGVKSTMDAAMELFGAANGALLGNNKGVEAVGAFYSAATGALATAQATNGRDAAVAAVGTAVAASKFAANRLSLTPEEIALLRTADQRADITTVQRAAELTVAGGEVTSKAIETGMLNSDRSIPRDNRIAETTGNALQVGGTVLTQASELLRSGPPPVPSVLSAVGGGVSLLGTTISTTVKYDRELDKAFAQVLDGRNERVQLDTQRDSTLTRINVKRIEFMEKIAALEAEISRSSCVK